MDSYFDLFYAGSPAPSSTENAPTGTQLTENSLNRCTPDELRSAVEQSSSSLTGLADGSRIPESAAWDAARAEIENGSCSAVVLHPANGLLGEIYAEASPPVAVLAISPAKTSAILISKETLSQVVQSIGDVADPIACLLSKLANEGQVKFLAEGVHCGIADIDLPELAPSEPSRKWNWLRDAIRECCNDSQLGDVDQRTHLRAALFQLNDYLDASHQASQSMEGDATADHWHAIMHRREPDYGNCKYWYRRVGQSPIFPDLIDQAVRLQQEMTEAADRKEIGAGQFAGQQWDAFAFVDLCADAARSGDEAEAALARQIQFAEMLLLLKRSL